MKKKLLTLSTLLTIAVLAVFLTFSVSAADAVQSGTWGNLSWTLNENTGELVISGNGTMDSLPETPWLTYSSKIKSVVIRDGVTSIGDHAFQNCKSLTRVTIADSVTSIGYLSFWNCSALSEITIPNSCTDVSDSAFSGCENIAAATIPGNAIPALPKRGLKHVTVTNGTSIPNGAFLDQISLTAISLPNTVTEIGRYAFYNCISLKVIVLPSGVTTIGGQAFQNCNKLESINLTDAITSLGASAFADCKSLRSIHIPQNLTRIENSVFEHCESLSAVTLPKQLKTIGNRAFYGCSNLSEVVFPDSITQLADFAFAGCTGLKKVVIPDSIQSISGYAFDTATNIETVVLPISFISVIPKNNLKTVVFTSGTSIYKSTFKYYKNLRKVIFCGTEQQWQSLQNDKAWMNELNQVEFRYHECAWTTTTSQHQGSCPHCGTNIQGEHLWDSGTVTQQPTHLATGRKANSCIVCEKTLVTVLEKDPKHPSGNWTEHDDKQHTKVCQCGQTVSENHNYSPWKTVTPATEKTAGQRQRVCACGYTASEVMPVLEHKYTATVVAPTCTDQGYTLHECKGCGDSYQDAFVSATGHTYDNNKDTECNSCGEIRDASAKQGNRLILWLAIGFGVIGAVAAAAGFYFKNKKGKNTG